MADQHVQGHALGVRDVPRRGLVVTFDGTQLEPAEAAELGQALLDQAQEAIHASRASRRQRVCSEGHSFYAFACSLPAGHDGQHDNGGVTW